MIDFCFWLFLMGKELDILILASSLLATVCGLLKSSVWSNGKERVGRIHRCISLVLGFFSFLFGERDGLGSFVLSLSEKIGCQYDTKEIFADLVPILLILSSASSKDPPRTNKGMSS
jgi:hypothetical protein